MPEVPIPGVECIGKVVELGSQWSSYGLGK